MMKRHGLRRIFSLLLAVIMVCALLPTATFAADTTEANLIVGGGSPRESQDPQEPKQEETAPAKPQWQDIRAEMQKVNVHVTCVNPDVKHSEKTYPYQESNDDTIGYVQSNAGSYTCTVTVHLGRYRTNYNRDFPREHKFASPMTANVVLKYNGTGWNIISGQTLELSLTCASAHTPDPPGQAVLDGLVVSVDCAAKTYHFLKTYKLGDGDYELQKVDDNTYTVTVKADKYVEKYNNDYEGHAIFGNSTNTIKLKYSNGAWNPVGSNSVTFTVSCEEIKYTVTYKDGVDGKIFANQVYNNLLSGTDTPAFNGTPTRTDYVFGGWNPAVAAKVTESKTYTATWKVDANGNGIADDEEDKYTVTYTDGADGKIFANQVYNNLLSGTDTPAFNGTPTRTDYVFGGWTPAVAAKVTESKTYTATWKVDANGNGIADDKENRYTITYTATWKANSGKDSPKTFDAGIAMYVGMALTSVAGSAVVIGKKKEF